MKREAIKSIAFKELGFSYQLPEKVFSGLSFEFPANEVLYLQGPRGSGKNTLIRLLLGLNSPTEGEYLINEKCVNDYSYRELDPFRLNMGYSFDVGGLINNLSLYENFKLLLDYHDFLPPAQRTDYLLNMMKNFHLEEQKHLRPALISSSARKAAAVLRAFLLRPEMIILNDPTQAMSMEHIRPLIDLIKEHQQEHNLKYVIISSDDTGLINQLSGRVLKVMPDCLIEQKQIRRAG